MAACGDRVDRFVWGCALGLILTGAAAGFGAASPMALPEGAEQVIVSVERGGNLLFVRAKIDGRECGWFLVDTGASHVTVHTAVADRLGLDLAGRAKVRGAVGGRVTFRKAQRLEIGRAVLRLGRVVAADLSAFREQLDVPLAGLLGYEAWAYRPFTLDYQARTITFHDGSRFRPPAGATATELRVTYRQATAAAVIDGKYRGRVMLDTGREGGLRLHRLYLAAHPALARGRTFTPGVAVEVGGERRSGYAPLDRLDVLGRTFRRLRTEFPPFEADEKARAPYLGVLGAACLRHFRLTFDYGSRRLWAEWRGDECAPDPLPAGFNVNAKDFLGLTPLHRAAAQGRADAVDRLIRAGAALDAKCHKGRTPLFVAANYGHAQIAQALLRAGADADAAGNQGETPLMIASQYGRLGVVRALLAAGADVEARSRKGRQALRLAAAHGHEAIVRALLAAGAKVDAASARGETALMVAAGAGRLGIARALVAAGADVNARARLGRRALSLAVTAGQRPMVRFLIDRRADVNAPNAQRMTPLMLAAFYGKTEIAADLLDAKAEVDARDLLGRTALMLAARAGQLGAAELLIRRGADVNARSHTGQTPLRLARAHKHAAVARALIQAGAKP